MNNLQHQLAVKEAVKGKFRGNKALAGKSIPRYPETAEREGTRIINAYMKLVNKAIKAHLPAILSSYKKVRHGDSRYDDAADFEGDVRREFQKIFEELEQKINSFGLEKLLGSVGTMTRSTSLREWKRVIQKTLGIDIFDDYYKGDYYDMMLRKWIDENVLKIKSIPNDTLSDLRQTIMDGYRRGATIRDLSKEIQDAYNVSKHKAQMLARDQIASLNAQITRTQQQDAGVNRYRWSASKDSRVRDCHNYLDGKTFSWDEPPEMWYETKSRGRVYTGRHCHPGEDYCCRCVAIPVFDIDTLDVPMQNL